MRDIPVQPYVQSDAVFGVLVGYLNSTLLDTDDGLVVLSATSRKVLGIFLSCLSYVNATDNFIVPCYQ